MKICFLEQKFIQYYDTKNKVSKERKVRFLNEFLLAILSIVLVFLVSFVGYCLYEDIRYNLLLLSKRTLEEYSLFCEDLSLSPGEDLLTFGTGNNSDLTVSVNANGKYDCKSKNLTELLKKVVERETRLRLAKGLRQLPYLSCGNESLAPQSGSLTVALNQISRQKLFSGDGNDAILHWENESEANTDAAEKHKNGEIIVTEGRTYFVYASVHFNISRMVTNETRNVNRLRTFSLRICRKTYGHEQTLLGETKQFNVSDGDVVSSLRIASHLHLNRNDTIYVKVKNVNYVISSSKGNTFGFFPL